MLSTLYSNAIQTSFDYGSKQYDLGLYCLQYWLPKCISEQTTIVVNGGITRLFAYCKGGNFNIHIWEWFGYLIC